MPKSLRQRLADLERREAEKAKATGGTLPRWKALQMLGGGVYEPAWIRKQYGIDDPVSEAIEEWWAAHRGQSWDEESFQRLLMEKAAREPERFRRLYDWPTEEHAVQTKIVEVDGQPLEQAPTDLYKSE